MTDNVINFEELLNEVKASGCLGQAQRQIDLFTFLLSKSQNAEFLDITQYQLAVDVFGRSEKFDPASDSIVRVEMHRLRSNLRVFSSRSETYKIEIPRASYQVVVTRKEDKPQNTLPNFRIGKPIIATGAALLFASGFLASAAIQTSQSTSNKVECSKILPNVFVENMGATGEFQRYVERVIKVTLSQHTNLNTLSQGSVCKGKSAPAFAVEYFVIEEGNQNFNVNITVKGKPLGNIISFDQITGKGIGDVDDESLYFEILKAVNEVAKPYGVIARQALAMEWGHPISQDNYRCLVAWYDSFAAEYKEEQLDAHACLKRSAQHDNAPPDIYGGLAANYLKQDRAFSVYKEAKSLPYKKATEIFERFDKGWVNSAEMVIARMAYEKQRKEYSPDKLRSVISVAKNRYDTNAIVLLYASYYAGYTLGDWENAKALSDRTKLFHSDRDQSVFVLDAAYAFLYEEPDEALKYCKKAYAKISIWENILLHACAKQAGNEEWVGKTSEALSSLEISNDAEKVAYVRSRKFDPVLTKKLEYVLTR